MTAFLQCCVACRGAVVASVAVPRDLFLAAVRAAVPAAVAALAVAALALAALGVGVAVVGVGVAAPPGLCPTAARATHPEVLVAAPRDLFLAAVRAAVPAAVAALAVAALPLAALRVGVVVVGVGVAVPPGLCPTAARATHPEVLVAAPRDLFLAAVRAAVPAAVAALAVAALALAVLGVGVAVVGVGVAAPPGLCPTAARATHPEVLVAAPRDLFLAAVRAAVPVAAAAMALAVLGVAVVGVAAPPGLCPAAAVVADFPAFVLSCASRFCCLKLLLNWQFQSKTQKRLCRIIKRFQLQVSSLHRMDTT